MTQPLNEFKAWYFKFPAFTRTFIAGSFIIVVLVSLGLLNGYYLYYDPLLAFGKLQLWRLFTSFLYSGKFSFHYLFSIYFTYFAISRVETELFNRSNYADFLWLVVYTWGTGLFASTVLGIPLPGQAFVFSFLYIWCKRKPFEIIRFLFGFEVKSGYFPLVYLGYNVLMGGSLIPYLIGLFFGHLYIHIKDVLTVKYRRDYLATPRFFTRFVQKYITKEIRRNGAGPHQQANPERGFFQGQGVRLG